MSPESRTPPPDPVKRKLSALQIGLPLALAFAPSATAVTYYWEGGNDSWGAASRWSDDEAGTGAGAAPVLEDSIILNTIGANSTNSVISLNGNRAVGSITIYNTGTTTLAGGTGVSNLTLGSGGLTIDSGAGATAIGGGSAGVPIRMTGSQTWTNHSSELFSMANSIAPESGVGVPVVLTIAGAGDTSLSYALNNGGANAPVSLVKTGSGVLDLTSGAAGSFSGGTTLAGGVVVASINGNLGADGGGLAFGGGTLRTTGSFSMSRSTTVNAGGATWETAAGTTLTQHGDISGSGAFVKTGAGTLLLGGNNSSFTGGITVNQGTLGFSTSDNRLGASGSAVVLNGGTLQATGETNFTLSASRSIQISAPVGTIDVSGSRELRVDSAITGNTLAKTGDGMLYLVGAKTYTGGTILNGGTILIYEDNRLGAAGGGLTFDGGTLRVNGSITMNRDTVLNSGGGTLSVDASLSLTQQGLVSGSGPLSKAGTGTLFLTNSASTFAGDVVVGEGTLTVSSLAANNGTTSALGNLTTPGKTITVNSEGTLILAINNALDNGTIPTAALVISGGTVSATRYNALGNVTLSNGATLSNASSDPANGAYDGYAFRGAVTVSAGGSTASTISTSNGSANHLGANTSFDVADVTGNTGADLVVSAPLRDQFNNGPAGGLTKSGTGTMELTAASTYSGTTTVSAGTLLVNNSSGSGTGTGTVSVAAGATLGGTGTVGGATVIHGTHAAGDSAVNGGIGAQTSSSNLTYAADSTFSWQLGGETTTGAGTNFDSVIVNGSLQIDGGMFRMEVAGLDLDSDFWGEDQAWDIFDSTSGSGSFSSFELYDSSDLVVDRDYSSYGSFSFSSGTGQLFWAAAVPEPTNALAGLLIGAGLFRRRRASRFI